MQFQWKALYKMISVVFWVCGLMIQSNAQNTFDLSTVEPDEIPIGATLSWYSAIPVTDETNVINDVSAVGPGIYYAVYKYNDECYSVPTPYRIMETVCPEAYADITAAVDSTDKPAGYNVTYHTAIPVSDANRLSNDPKQAPPGSYYASYYDPVEMCYVGVSPITVLAQECCEPLRIKVLLEGALIAGQASMRDNLRNSPFTSQNYLPMQEPYTGLVGFTHVGNGGGEEAESTAFDDRGENSIVDWVFIELRNKSNNTEVVVTRSALLQRDGDVVDVDGISTINFCGLLEEEYFVVVRHRNHFGVMTKMAESILSGIEIDFTNGNAALSGEFDFGSNHPQASGYNYTGLAQKNFGSFRAMWAGNAAQDQKIKYEAPVDDNSVISFNVLFHPNNTSFQSAFDFGFGYFAGDLDMNSKVKYETPSDDQSFLSFQLLFYPLNTSFQSAFDFLLEQIP